MLLLVCLQLLSFDKSPNTVKESQNMLVIGFDGCRREIVEQLLKEGVLPNLALLIKTGSYVKTKVTVDATETKPGWSQILSGYSSSVTNIHDNLMYQPIPKGLTIFEKLKQSKGNNFKTFFVTGKINNTGARGPHDVCVNCKTRFDVSRLKTNWWEVSKNAPLAWGKKIIVAKRTGEPFFNALSSLDFYESGISNSDSVVKLGLEQVNKIKMGNFFGFIHFEEPDETGHIKGEGSPEYKEKIKNDDLQLGKIIDYLKTNNLYQNTDLIVVTDHGFKPGGFGHSKKSENTWIVSSFKLKAEEGDRLDVTPTILSRFGIKQPQNLPKMEGKSLME
jgi:hypothetical protein